MRNQTLTVKEIRNELEEVSKISDIVLKIDSSEIRRVTRKNRYAFLNALMDGDRAQINKLLDEAKKIKERLKSKDEITECLICLNYYLISLKVCTINNDQKKVEKILKKFVKENILSLKDVNSELSEFEYLIFDLKEHYTKICEFVKNVTGSEDNLIVLQNALPFSLIDSLFEIQKKQKRLFREISKIFVSLMKELSICEKEYLDYVPVFSEALN